MILIAQPSQSTTHRTKCSTKKEKKTWDCRSPTNETLSLESNKFLSSMKINEIMKREVDVRGKNRNVLTKCYDLFLNDFNAKTPLIARGQIFYYFSNGMLNESTQRFSFRFFFLLLCGLRFALFNAKELSCFFAPRSSETHIITAVFACSRPYREPSAK